ncbi:MAG TPA: RNA polymerase sigma factor [Cytophagaceae bacterium]|nr:RNA polymerase sigma factor [Cytophagaceae bacterium]
MDPDEHRLVEGCKAEERAWQELLYKRYSARMMALCLRYSKSREEAEDILQDGFVKVFSSIHQFRELGSLEGWIRKIMVNMALTNYRKNAKKYYADTDILELQLEDHDNNNILGEINKNDLLQLIQSLSPGYQMVFNMYSIEGYSHKEIAEQLGISESTSKSQLSRAKQILQKSIAEILNRVKISPL